MTNELEEQVNNYLMLGNEATMPSDWVTWERFLKVLCKLDAVHWNSAFDLLNEMD